MKRLLSVLLLVSVLVLWMVGSRAPRNSSSIPNPPTINRESPPSPIVKPPAPSINPTHVALQPDAESLSIFQKIARNDTNVAKLPLEQVEAYLAQNHSNVESLVTAYNVTGNKAYLRQAVTDAPTNSLALASAILLDGDPDKRSEWIGQLKNAAPENALADYLSARENFRGTNIAEALADLTSAGSKPVFQDYTLERLQGLEEIYMTAGHSAAEAKALAMVNIHLPHLREVNQVGSSISALETQYIEAGDSESAQNLARMGLHLADSLSQSGAYSMLSQAVGIAVQQNVLKPLDPNQTYDFISRPITEYFTDLDAQRADLRTLGATFDQWIQVASEPQLVSYFDRMKLYGEAAALRWAQTQPPLR